MKVWTPTSIPENDSQPVAAALGMFDGVHLGHQHVIRQALLDAHGFKGRSVVITFDPHPLTVLRPAEAPRLLQSLSQRLSALAAFGVDATWVIPFTHGFSRLSGVEFIEFLIQHLHPLRSLTVGQGFGFGHKRSGSVDLLRRFGSEHGFQVHEAASIRIGNHVVSSTRVRAALRQGDLTHVAELLGRPYSIRGTVQQGDGLGRTIGFPTANLAVHGLELPPFGVYAAWTRWADREWLSAVNIGVRPTLTENPPEVRFEVHLMPTSGHESGESGQDLGDIYNQELNVEPVAFLRPEKRFPSLRMLKMQIEQDLMEVRQRLTSSGKASGLPTSFNAEGR